MIAARIRPQAPPPGELARQLVGRDYLSYSALHTYQQCPLRYYFSYVIAQKPEFVTLSTFRPAFGAGRGATTPCGGAAGATPADCEETAGEALLAAATAEGVSEAEG